MKTKNVLTAAATVAVMLGASSAWAQTSPAAQPGTAPMTESPTTAPSAAPSTGTPAAPASAIRTDRKDDSSGSVGQFVDDATVTARVKTSFATDEDVKARNIKVETTKGVVHLSGEAHSQHEVDRALQLAREVSDVQSVTQDIVIKPNR
jgi:hyperosmotically inducible protein